MIDITADAIKMIFYRLKKKTGISRLHPHLLRHTYATLYLVNGGDIISLGIILGHSQLKMVQHYSHLAAAHLITKNNQFSPLNNIHLN